jgi:hypothetical protein
MSDDRRELLEAALEQAEEGTLEAPIEKEIEVNDDPIQTENASEEGNPEENNNRDEKGRFKAKKPVPSRIPLKNLTWWEKLVMLVKRK